MIANLENWTIVVAGHWNRMIFTPEWVGRNLFGAQAQTELLVAVMPDLPIIYRNAQINLQVSSSRLLFAARLPDDNCIIRAEQMADAALEQLPNTPITGVGVNFGFVEPEPSDRLLELFNLADDANLAGQDWQIRHRRIDRQLERNGEILNFSLTFDGQRAMASFNFHTETADTARARQAVTNQAVRLKNLAVEFLTALYGLQLAPEEAQNG